MHCAPATQEDIPRQKPAVIVFARLPTANVAKTRLGKTLRSPHAAAEFYGACAEHTIRQISRCADVRLHVYGASAEEVPAMRDWLVPLNPDLTVVPQRVVPDLGARMRAALEAELQRVPKVVLFGTDIPDVSPEIVSAALAALDRHHLVLGPAADGGFYCIGISAAMPPGFLEGLTWSTEHVLHDTLQQAVSLGIEAPPAAALPIMADIDVAQDLQDWVRQSPHDHPLQGAAQQALAAAEGGD